MSGWKNTNHHRRCWNSCHQFFQLVAVSKTNSSRCFHRTSIIIIGYYVGGEIVAEKFPPLIFWWRIAISEKERPNSYSLESLTNHLVSSLKFLSNHSCLATSSSSSSDLRKEPSSHLASNQGNSRCHQRTNKQLGVVAEILSDQSDSP